MLRLRYSRAEQTVQQHGQNDQSKHDVQMIALNGESHDCEHHARNRSSDKQQQPKLNDALAMKMHRALHDRRQSAQRGSFSAEDAEVCRLQGVMRQVNYRSASHYCRCDDYTSTEQISNHDLNSVIVQKGMRH